MRRLEGKVALITGAGSGIGRASALRFAQEGARVLIAELQPELGKSAEAAVRGAGGDALFAETDVRREESVQGAVAAALARFGRLDVLFNCAGGSVEADVPVTEIDLEVYESTLALDLRGTFLCCRHAIPEIVRAGGGSVINTSSIVALRGSYPMHAYASAKGAILSLTRALAGSYAAQGVRVNAICPGMVLSERIRKRLGPDAERAPLGERHPFAIGQPVDIANVALFLASDESRMVTGAVIPAEGGLSAY
jgi:NAD(P)-dependent dehydrogenase (short-subunit alcohol dehydrogenase family)